MEVETVSARLSLTYMQFDGPSSLTSMIIAVFAVYAFASVMATSRVWDPGESSGFMLKPDSERATPLSVHAKEKGPAALFPSWAVYAHRSMGATSDIPKMPGVQPGVMSAIRVSALPSAAVPINFRWKNSEVTGS